MPPSRVNVANLTTLAGAALGLAALGLAARGLLAEALTALVGAVLCDNLDGALARRLGLASDFGRELDSLADAVSFLVAPAGMVLLASGADPRVGLAGGAYVLAGLWRLAGFNLGAPEAEGFRGLPTTLAASWFILGWVALRRSPWEAQAPLALAAWLLAACPLMLSSLPVSKRGLAVRATQALALPGLLALWWPRG